MHRRTHTRLCAPRYLVFIVDDDPDTREMLVALLGSRGFLTRAFPDAELTLAAALERTPHLVLADLDLHGVSGAELALALRRSPTTADIALAAMTGIEEPAWETQRLFDLYLRKPLDPESMPDLLRSLIESVARARAQRARGS